MSSRCGVSEVETVDQAEEDPTLSPDAVFDVLADRRRRYALYYLRECTYAVGLAELAEQVAAWESGVDRGAVGDEHRERVRLELHHAHLPKAAGLGVVRYDAESETVAMGPAAGAVSAYLDRTASQERDRLPADVEV